MLALDRRIVSRTGHRIDDATSGREHGDQDHYQPRRSRSPRPVTVVSECLHGLPLRSPSSSLPQPVPRLSPSVIAQEGPKSDGGTRDITHSKRHSGRGQSPREHVRQCSARTVCASAATARSRGPTLPGSARRSPLGATSACLLRPFHMRSGASIPKRPSPSRRTRAVVPARRRRLSRVRWSGARRTGHCS